MPITVRATGMIAMSAGRNCSIASFGVDARLELVDEPRARLVQPGDTWPVLALGS